MRVLILALLLVSCAEPDCPESEKVVVRYETTTINAVTTSVPVLGCLTSHNLGRTR